MDFELQVATVDPQIEGFDPSPLKGYVSGLGLDHHDASEAIAEWSKDHMGRDSFCAFCSRMRRGILYRVAREQGCNVLVLAQHLDDLAESFVMSAFYAGDLRVIRPLVYVRERQNFDFAKTAGLPVIADNCPACY